MLPETKVTVLQDWKHHSPKKPNYVLEALYGLMIIVVVFGVFFMLAFSHEILKAFG